MSIMTAKQAQERAKAKASRLVGMSNTQKPFYGAGVFNAEEKTGKQPVAKKAGGRLLSSAAEGSKPGCRADRKGRKAGGRLASGGSTGRAVAGGTSGSGVSGPTTNEEAKDRRLPSAEEAMSRSGKYQNYKKGGKIKRASGGPSPSNDAEEDVSNIKPANADYSGMRLPIKKGGKVVKKAGGGASDGPDKENDGDSDDNLGNDVQYYSVMNAEEGKPMSGAAVQKAGSMNKGGRAKRAWVGSLNGGSKKKSSKGKGKTNIQITFDMGKDQAGDPPGQMPVPVPPMAAPPRAITPPSPPPGAGPTPGNPPPGLTPNVPPPGAGPAVPPGVQPMARKSGGRTGNASYASLKAGAGSGLGRLHKAGIRSVSH